MNEISYIYRKIDSIIFKIKDKSFAIYPCGRIGELTNDYLKNKYQLSADFLIDNHKAKTNKEYISFNELEGLNCSKLVVLIACSSNLYYEEIQKEIGKYISDQNIVILCPHQKMRYNKIVDKIVWERLLYPHGKNSFLRGIKNTPDTRVLDVGCGNKSPENIKKILSKVYYIGIDVGDYNQTENSKKCVEEYYIVKSKKFAEEIEKYKNSFDVVISSHNIEHCEEPKRVLLAMIDALKKGGRLYMSFPSEESQYFPKGRNGCLNFYDDCSHKKIPNWEEINLILIKRKMNIIFKTKNNQPYLMSKIGALNEIKSAELKTVLTGTWEYYGFESIIWAKK